MVLSQKSACQRSRPRVQTWASGCPIAQVTIIVGPPALEVGAQATQVMFAFKMDPKGEWDGSMPTVESVPR
jgi:hypothetical protein